MSWIKPNLLPDDGRVSWGQTQTFIFIRSLMKSTALLVQWHSSKRISTRSCWRNVSSICGCNRGCIWIQTPFTLWLATQSSYLSLVNSPGSLQFLHLAMESHIHQIQTQHFRSNTNLSSFLGNHCQSRCSWTHCILTSFGQQVRPQDCIWSQTSPCIPNCYIVVI